VSTFLAFLLRTGRIPAANLARAQVEQLRRLPSLVEIAESKGLLEPEAILRVLLLQEEKEISFPQACRDLGYWNTELEQRLKSELNERRVPLCELLSADSSLPPGTANSLWEEFTREASSPGNASTALASPSVSPCPETNDALLDESLRGTWDALVALGQADCAQPEQLRAVMHAFHRIKGTIRLQGPAMAERWADFGEQTFKLAAEAAATTVGDLTAAGFDAVRTIAAEANPAVDAIPAARKEQLINLLKNLRRAADQARPSKGESA
jgi:hypothetical protein